MNHKLISLILIICLKQILMIKNLNSNSVDDRNIRLKELYNTITSFQKDNKSIQISINEADSKLDKIEFNSSLSQNLLDLQKQVVDSKNDYLKLRNDLLGQIDRINTENEGISNSLITDIKKIKVMKESLQAKIINKEKENLSLIET